MSIYLKSVTFISKRRFKDEKKKRNKLQVSSQVVIVVQNSPASSGDTGSIPGSGRSPGEGHGNQLQYSCLENLMDRGAWQATVHRVTKSWTRLKQLSMHAQEAQEIHRMRRMENLCMLEHLRKESY